MYPATDQTGSLPHPHLSDQVNSNLIRSEIEGGVYLKDLPPDSRLEVQTQNNVYTLVIRNQEEGLIAGHPQFCPQPVLVRIVGSTWGGSMLKAAYLGRGMHLEFLHPSFDGPIVTSRIVEIRQLRH
jgi:hypothetical protein